MNLVRALVASGLGLALASGFAYAGSWSTSRTANTEAANQRLRPTGAVRIAVAGFTGADLVPEDRVRVVGTVRDGGRRLRVIVVPRASMSRVGLVIDDDGALDGRVAYFTLASAERRRINLAPGSSASVMPADVRFVEWARDPDAANETGVGPDNLDRER
jgi:hypothetical protein